MNLYSSSIRFFTTFEETWRWNAESASHRNHSAPTITEVLVWFMAVSVVMNSVLFWHWEQQKKWLRRREESLAVVCFLWTTARPAVGSGYGLNFTPHFQQGNSRLGLLNCHVKIVWRMALMCECHVRVLSWLYRASADMSCHTSIRKRKIINTIRVVEGFLPGENFCSKKALCTSVHQNLKCFYS